MNRFALITEGVTDQIIIENVLKGYFNNPNLSVNPLQPLCDATDRARQASPGNWNHVLDYCNSEELMGASQFNDYLIIQIDTDVSEERGFDVPKKEKGRDLSVAELVERVRNKLIGLIGNSKYELIKSQVIFAIGVHSSECWLLPLHTEDKKRAKRIENCLGRLNRFIYPKLKFTIDPENKNTNDYYEKISKGYRNHKVLKAKYKSNPSFEIFLKNLENIFHKFSEN